MEQRFIPVLSLLAVAVAPTVLPMDMAMVDMVEALLEVPEYQATQGRISQDKEVRKPLLVILITELRSIARHTLIWADLALEHLQK